MVYFAFALLFSAPFAGAAADSPKTIRVGVMKGGLLVIEKVILDDYVKRILPNEVSPGWPPEALKAQAVASRTFALRSLNRHQSQGYNLCATVHCQVFGGLESEADTTNQAVDDTHNEILLYKDKPAGTFFFSNCGGRTADPADVWNNSESPPYLKPIRCKFCKSGKHHEWEASLSEDDLVAALVRSHFSVVPPLRSIRTDFKGGRAKTVWVRHAGGETQMISGKFRAAVGANLIRSAYFTKIKKVRDGFEFRGKGWGHGVGLCQEGANGMALQGWRYKKILKFYYPGTNLQKYDD
ncbi:MAG: hypothetical protein A2901_00185 [Elusimicrobia bacterium RIFCSPLOWO2_01_FULL_54_10]|nr:MAG: hypothetical protein A2901_00185 [Elusimicrobia bacterium RIFCSPLOWO2_01_FULL_54_10]